MRFHTLLCALVIFKNNTRIIYLEIVLIQTIYKSSYLLFLFYAFIIIEKRDRGLNNFEKWIY